METKKAIQFIGRFVDNTKFIWTCERLPAEDEISCAAAVLARGCVLALLLTCHTHWCLISLLCAYFFAANQIWSF